MPAEGLGAESGLHRLHRHCYDPEYARMEAWLDEHPDFVQDYFLRQEMYLLYYSQYNMQCFLATTENVKYNYKGSTNVLNLKIF